jgi:predicted DNA binding CopG/RHH family protein
MKKQIDPFENIFLDEYEQELERELEKGNFQRVENFEETKKMLQAAAKYHLELKKSKSITLRVKQEDLIKLKARAKREGIPYQTLISMLIRQFAEGKTSIKI